MKKEMTAETIFNASNKVRRRNRGCQVNTFPLLGMTRKVYLSSCDLHIVLSWHDVDAGAIIELNGVTDKLKERRK